MTTRKDQDPRNEEKPREPRRDAPERTAAPPIEREHETQAGVFEEEEGKDSERH